MIQGEEKKEERLQFQITKLIAHHVPAHAPKQSGT
jgi:hypothetical protein